MRESEVRPILLSLASNDPDVDVCIAAEDALEEMMGWKR
jgi:hypothetical protein